MLVVRCCVLMLVTFPVWAGDPMRPPNLEAPAQEILHEPLRLSMILNEQGRKRAVVNGKVMDVSDRVGTARLLAIHEDYVVMQQAGERIDLRLHGVAIKQASEGEAHE